MNDSFDLRQYISLAWKWWWLVALLAIFGAAGGYVVSQRQPLVYKAFTTIMVGQSITESTDEFDISTSQQLAQTYADMAQRQPVLQAVVDTLGLSSSWQALEGRVQARPVPGTQLLEITVQAKSPEEAQATANEIARQLILLSPTERQKQERAESQQFVRGRLETIQAKIEAGEERLKSLEATLDSPLSVEQTERVQAELDKVERLIADWEANYGQLLTYMDGTEDSPNSLTIIEPAQADPNPVPRETVRNTLMAALVGLGLAAGIVFFVEYLDNTLKSPDEVKRSLHLSTLGSIYNVKWNSYLPELITVAEPFSPSSEAFRMIRSNMQFMSVDQPVKSVLVTSPAPGEGKSTTAANLAVVMAQAGLQTVLVDADLRRPTQHQIFQISEHYLLLGGLTDLLSRPEAEIQSFLRKTKIDNLKVLTCGTLPPNPSELMGSKRMQQVLSSLNDLADIIIIDTPPAAVVTDAVVLATKVDGVVLINEAGKTRLDIAQQVVAQLEQAGAHLLGVILNRVSARSGGYYYYQSYYSPHLSPTQTGQPVRERKVRARRLRWLPFLRS